jgi:hypothetical protein
MGKSVGFLLIALKEEQVKGIDFVTVKNINERHRAISLAAHHKPSAEAESEIDNFPVEVDSLR